MNKLKTWSDIIGVWVTIIGVFTGGIFAVTEYLEKSSSERVKVTLEYVERFNKEPLHPARLHLEDIWYPKADELFKKTSLGSDELSAFIVQVIQKNKLEHDIDLIVDFYDNLRACACANLCDEDTVQSFFGKHASDFYGLNFPYISEQRQRIRDYSYGVAVESFSKSYKNGEAFSKSICKVSSALNK